MKEIRCSELGFFPDCQGVMRGEDEEEVMAAAAEHGRNRPRHDRRRLYRREHRNDSLSRQRRIEQVLRGRAADTPRRLSQHTLSVRGAATRKPTAERHETASNDIESFYPRGFRGRVHAGDSERKSHLHLPGRTRASGHPRGVR
jgi:hypothetical protein